MTTRKSWTPITWNHRYTVVLYMHIAGQRNVDIAKSLKATAHWVGEVIHSPLFQARKTELLEELKASTFDDLVERIRKTTPETFEALIRLRDTASDEKTQLGAARALMSEADRVWPKRTEHVEEKTVRLVFDQGALDRMANAMAAVKGHELPAVDAKFKKLPSPPQPETMEAQQADDYIHELEERAAAEINNDG